MTYDFCYASESPQSTTTRLFFFHMHVISSKFDDKLSPNFHRIFYAYFWDIPSENTAVYNGLFDKYQTCPVSSAFKTQSLNGPIARNRLWPQSIVPPVYMY